MARTVLVVAAHPDDEVLGCGGTLARHVAEGDVVHVIFMADGVTSRSASEKDEFTQRERASKEAQKLLGIRSTRNFGLPDNGLDGLPILNIVQPLEDAIRTLAPELIYTHHYGDLNVDHRITHQAVMTACRPLNSSTAREIYSFEVMSSTEWNSVGVDPFVPQLYVDITDYFDAKLAALDAYRIEMREAPHSRSLAHLRALAVHRGHCVGVGAAEAFMVMRMIR